MGEFIFREENIVLVYVKCVDNSVVFFKVLYESIFWVFLLFDVFCVIGCECEFIGVCSECVNVFFVMCEYFYSFVSC